MKSLTNSKTHLKCYATRLIALRDDLNLSQKEVAEKFGVDPAELCRLETGVSVSTTLGMRLACLEPRLGDCSAQLMELYPEAFTGVSGLQGSGV